MVGGELYLKKEERSYLKYKFDIINEGATTNSEYIY